MQVDLFRYSLRRYNTIATAYEYYYIDSNGALQSTFTPTALQYAPQGWEDQSLKWERGTTYYGVFTNYTNPLRFVKDGRKILKTLYYNNGVNQTLELLIEKHSNLVASWGYQTYYVGDIDFSRFKDAKDFTQVEIMEQGFMSKLKANEDTMYEVPITGGTWVKLDGYPLQGVANYTGIPDEYAKEFYYLLIFTGRIPTYAYIDNIGYNNAWFFQDNSFYNNPSLGIELLDSYFIWNNSNQSQTFDLTHNYYFNVYLDNSAPNPSVFKIQYYITQGLTLIATNDMYLSPSTIALGSSQTFLGTLNNQITLAPNQRMTIVVNMYDPTTSQNVIPNDWTCMQLNGNSLVVNWQSKVPDSYVQCLTQQQIGQALTQKIDANSDFVSDSATATPDYLLISGDGLRNLNNAVIKTSLGDFFQSV